MLESFVNKRTDKFITRPLCVAPLQFGLYEELEISSLRKCLGRIYVSDRQERHTESRETKDRFTVHNLLLHSKWRCAGRYPQLTQAPRAQQMERDVNSNTGTREGLPYLLPRSQLKYTVLAASCARLLTWKRSIEPCMWDVQGIHSALCPKSLGTILNPCPAPPNLSFFF